MSDTYLDMGNDIYTLASGDVVEFSSIDTTPYLSNVRKVRTITPDGSANAMKYVEWGDRNREPDDRELLAMDNNIVAPLLQTKRDFLLGAGLMLYKESYQIDANGYSQRIVEEMDMTDAMKEFIEMNEMDDFHRRAAKDLVLHAQYFPEYINQAGGAVESVEALEAKYMRAEEMMNITGRTKINNWLLCGDWENSRKANVTVTRIPAYDKKKDWQPKYVRRIADEMYGGPYYFAPAWWASRNWIKLANCIPEFHLANMKNGYLIRYHIQYPKDYFYKSEKPYTSLTPDEKKEALSNAENRKTQFLKKLNDILMGAKNAGRSIFTTYDVNQMVGKEFPGIKISQVETELYDEKLLTLFDKSNDANISAQSILPSISGVQMKGNLSSGSDIRNAYAYYLAIKVPEYRRLLYFVINDIGKRNGWFTGELEGAKFGARDTVIATTDKEPTGISANENVMN